jgi:hypothetical protein
LEKVGTMHGMLEAGKRRAPKALSPVRWRRAIAERMTDAKRMRQQTNSRLITAMVVVALATTLFVFVALP